MSKPTAASVTEVPCSCGYLENNVRNPHLPLKFKPELNEYHFEHRLPTGSTVSIVLYHCPMCGGVASESRRHKLFAAISDDELQRLQSLIADLKTALDIERSLGVPDKDETIRPPADFGVVQPQTGKPETGPIRVLTYTRLSDTANVQFTIYSNAEVQGVVAEKYIGPPGLTDT